jgi:hypothetical protein
MTGDQRIGVLRACDPCALPPPIGRVRGLRPVACFPGPAGEAVADGYDRAAPPATPSALTAGSLLTALLSASARAAVAVKGQLYRRTCHAVRIGRYGTQLHVMGHDP